jgi:hypothetical protein
MLKECLGWAVQERSGDSTERETLAGQLAAARTDAAARVAESKALRKHARALERQLRDARSGASLQDIKAVSGRDGRLVSALLSPCISSMMRRLLCSMPATTS